MIRSLLAVFVLLAACGAPSHPPSLRASDYPGELVPSASIARSFMARQSVTARFGPREASFDAVLQVHDGVVTVVGLTPMGTRAFTITQRGTDVSYEPSTDRPLPFPPEFILRDIHRAHFIEIGGVLSDGEHSIERDGERITERWHAGRVLERRFRRLDDAPRGEISVRYEGVAPGGVLPSRTHLDNAWFGYALDIVTVEAQAL